MTTEDAVAGIAATTTYQGLKCTAVLDGADYPGGVKISDERMKYLEDRVLDRHGTHGEWNYTVRPAPRPGRNRSRPGARGPDPALLEGLAALAGVADLGRPARRRRRALAGRPRAAPAPGPRRRPP